MNKRNSIDRLLQLVYFIVAASDVLIGLTAVFFPSVLISLAGVPPPLEMFYFRWAGLSTAALAGAYVMAGIFPDRYYPIIIISIAARAVTAIFLFVGVQGGQAPPYFLTVSGGETLLFLHHVIYAVRFAPGRLSR